MAQPPQRPADEHHLLALAWDTKNEVIRLVVQCSRPFAAGVTACYAGATLGLAAFGAPTIAYIFFFLAYLGVLATKSKKERLRELDGTFIADSEIATRERIIE
jgi:hypothetical protein